MTNLVFILFRFPTFFPTFRQLIFTSRLCGQGSPHGRLDLGGILEAMEQEYVSVFLEEIRVPFQATTCPSPHDPQRNRKKGSGRYMRYKKAEHGNRPWEKCLSCSKWMNKVIECVSEWIRSLNCWLISTLLPFFFAIETCIEVGDFVALDEEIATIETDKVRMLSKSQGTEKNREEIKGTG